MTTNIAKAETEAQAMIMIAEAEAKANDLLSQSLNSNLLDKMYFEKWTVSCLLFMVATV